MKQRSLLAGVALLAALLTGCYNNPKVSEKVPGEGPKNYMSKPSVGPGTTAGGSTAGPQPKTASAAKSHESAAPAAH